MIGDRRVFWKSQVVWMTTGLTFANVLLLLPRNSKMPLLGGALLFCVIPGLALVNLVFAKSGRLKALSRLLLGMAMSYVLSNLIVLGLSLLPGGMSVRQVVLVLDLVSLTLIGATCLFNSGDFERGTEKGIGGAWGYIIVLLIVLCVFRFVSLDYSIERGDEMPLVSLAANLIRGEASLLLDQRKGPSQVTTAVAFALFDNGYNEFALRVPFALASVVSVLLLYLLGREMFSDRIGFLGGLLLALDGNFLAHSRLIQFQPLVLLTAVSAVYCVWRAGSAAEEADRSRYLLLGSALFGFGCLTHYGGIVVAPVLGFLYLAQKRASRKRELLLVVGCALVILVMVSLYYIPFFFAEEHGGNRAHYFGKRLGWDRGVFNTFRELLSLMAFMNSIYYVVFMWLTLIGALYVLWAEADRLKAAVLIAGSSLVLGLLISFCCPDAIQVGSVNAAVILFVPLLTLLIWGNNLSLGGRAMWLWLMTGFVILGFFSRRPHTHWYVVAVPWVLLSAVAVDRVLAFLERGMTRSTKRLVWVPFVILVVLFAGYLYMFFLQEFPAYAINFPKYKSRVYWTPQNELTGEMSTHLIKGTPKESGWEVLGYLYRVGQMRGHLRLSPERHLRRERITAEWYMGHKWDVDDSSRYVIYPGYGTGSYTRKAIEQWYDLVGRVLVHGVPKLWIYERKDVTKGEPVVDYRFEEYEPLYDAVVSLDEQFRFDEVGVDKKTYFREAGLVEATSEPGDEIVFTEREQVGLFSYHYTGDLAYHIPELAVEPEDLEKWLKEWEGAGKAYIVYWVAGESEERAEWDRWLSTMDGIRESAWHRNVGLAVYSENEEVSLHLLEGSELGESIELLGYEVGYSETDRVVELGLYWAMEEYVWRDYTVFTHLLDDQGNMVGQKDNQPVGGMLPTSVWRTDKVVRDEYEISVDEVGPGEYWIEVGMYDAGSGERLPTSGQGALPDGRIRLPWSVEID